LDIELELRIALTDISDQFLASNCRMSI